MLFTKYKVWALVLLATFSVLFFAGCDAKHSLTPVEDKKKDGPDGPSVENFSPAGLLRKTSLHLRGQHPSSEEYLSLKNANPEKVNEMILSWAKKYLESPGHRRKMIFRMQETFQLNPKDPGQQDSFSKIIDRVVRQNLSWDEVFVGKTYEVSSEELKFYELANPTVSETVSGEYHIEFPAKDARVAGAITTPRFFNRYVNTVTNENRRRAAGLFKVMLCKDFRTALDSALEQEKEILKLVFPKSQNSSRIVHGLRSDKHDTDPACIKCHRQLDPMGKTFRGIASQISPMATPGALVIETDDGIEVKEADGLGELVEMAVESEAYVRCQTQHFWDWFIGTDAPLTEERHSQLIQVFENGNRRINDFILYLVQQPEFGQMAEKTEEDIRLMAKEALKSCDSCHVGGSVPKFSEWPIGGSQQSHSRWLGDLARVLDLENLGVAKTMPPKNSPWQPTQNQLQIIQQWINQGGEI